MTTEPAFDAAAPLPGPSDPWTSSGAPSARSGPPYHMTDMIAAEPALARRVVERTRAAGTAAALADAVRAALIAGDPVVVTGCGTSEHAALGVVEILREAADVAGLSKDWDRSGPGVRAVARPADQRARDRDHTRRRHAARRTPPSVRRGKPERGRPSSPSAAGPPLRPTRMSSSRPANWTRVGATPSATSARWPRRPPWAPSCPDARSMRRTSSAC